MLDNLNILHAYCIDSQTFRSILSTIVYSNLIWFFENNLEYCPSAAYATLKTMPKAKKMFLNTFILR